MKIDTSVLNERVEKIWPPPIPFKFTPKSNKKKTTDEEEEKAKTATFEILLDPNEVDGKEYDRKIKIFEDGSPEEWVLHIREVEDLIAQLRFTKADQQINVWRSVLRGKAKEIFRAAWNKRNTENQGKAKAAQTKEEEILKAVINDCSKKFFGANWSGAARRQKSYMRNNLQMGDKNPETFYDRLKKMNSYLPYFPTKDGQPKYHELPEDELIDILDRSNKIEWHLTMLSQGKQPDNFETPEEMVEY
jgi:hypothetical protein